MNTLQRLQAHLAAPCVTTRSGTVYKPVLEAVLCADGSTMSVQASETHYSSPRTNEGPYTEVEVWCCGVIPAWDSWGDGDEPYAYLPIDLVVQEIDRRGGFHLDGFSDPA